TDSDMDACSRSGKRYVCARMCDGRACLQTKHRSAGIASDQLRRNRSGKRKTLVKQSLARMLPARCREVRMEEPKDGAAVDAGWPTSRRLGNGDRRMGGVSIARECEDHISS